MDQLKQGSLEETSPVTFDEALHHRSRSAHHASNHTLLPVGEVSEARDLVGEEIRDKT